MTGWTNISSPPTIQDLKLEDDCLIPPRHTRKQRRISVSSWLKGRLSLGVLEKAGNRHFADRKQQQPQGVTLSTHGNLEDFTDFSNLYHEKFLLLITQESSVSLHSLEELVAVNFTYEEQYS